MLFAASPVRQSPDEGHSLPNRVVPKSLRKRRIPRALEAPHVVSDAATPRDPPALTQMDVSNENQTEGTTATMRPTHRSHSMAYRDRGTSKDDVAPPHATTDVPGVHHHLVGLRLVR